MQGPQDPETSDSEAGLGTSEPDVDSEVELEGLSKEQGDLYDDKADDADEAWAVQQRSGRKSDAHLSCPSCLSTLTIDCQRHAFNPDQYRAIFVTNCRCVMPGHLAPVGCSYLASWSFLTLSQQSSAAEAS